jgi:hypothetical protein
MTKKIQYKDLNLNFYKNFFKKETTIEININSKTEKEIESKE